MSGRASKILKLALASTLCDDTVNNSNNTFETDKDKTDQINEGIIDSALNNGIIFDDSPNIFCTDLNANQSNSETSNVVIEYLPQLLLPNVSNENILCHENDLQVQESTDISLIEKVFANDDSTHTSEETNKNINELGPQPELITTPVSSVPDNDSSSYELSEDDLTSKETNNVASSSEDEDGLSKKKIHKRTKRRLLKDSGQQYTNTSGNVIEEKKMKPNPCQNKKCHNQCNSFTEVERKKIFSYFWNLRCSTKQKTFLNDCVTVNNVKRRRKSRNIKKRNVTNEYFLKRNSIRQQVCRQFLINTLCITVRLLRTVCDNKEERKCEEKDNRGKHIPHNKISGEQVEQFKTFIKSIPAVPSHYCRSSSSKRYLPAEIKSYSNLYRMYVKHQREENLPTIKKMKFMQLLKSHFNLGIHVPRKDKCSKCERYKNLSNELKTELEENSYQQHINEKDTIKNFFLNEQKSSQESNMLVASFDLQKVLSTPHGDNLLLGFSRKYAVYNFTVYESVSRRGYCFLWEEKDGKRGANEICSNILAYLKIVDQEAKYKELSLYCDNCCGQNKNKYLFLMLRYFLNNSTNVEKISVTFLITGHTYMPVDSVHGVIEKSINRKIVQAPSEWATILRNARLHPEPYIIIKQKYYDFFDFKSLCTEGGGKFKISEVKKATFNKSNFNIQIIYSFSEQTEETVYFKLKPTSEPKAAYGSELPINKLKYDNLKKLCTSMVIKPEYHYEYLTLKCSATVPDVLNETDNEDEK